MNYFKNILLIFLCTFTSVCAKTQNNELIKEFNFGKNLSQNSGVSINKPFLYTDSLGYGFDFRSYKNVKFKNDYLSGIKSVYFSVKLPEGNYKVDLVLGGNKCAVTTVKAESRRLMLNSVKTNRNETVTKSFTVNVRTPSIDDNHKVKLKSREFDYLNWDNKLTLEFLGEFCIQSIRITPTSKVTTIFLAGDSTVTDQDIEPWASWGQYITNYFSSDVVIANHAASGLALSSFKSGNRLIKILSEMKAGDYLFIEFGHNDEKTKGEGNGAWGLYTNLLKEFIYKFREKGGIPILVTPTQRRHFNEDGDLKSTHGDFPDAMRKVAKDLNVPLIDLTKMTTLMYESWGDETSRNAFVQYPSNTFPGQTEKLEDNTHFNNFGANEIAKAVLLGIQQLKLDIAKYINPNTPNYNPNKPDNIQNWNVPMSLRFDTTKPEGN
ncbi:rhamnogalacturonan acetylesterase [Mariniflexile sp. HNIBRBA6329]|uniref:rhamnogalacturonan acetylesterase n=1 Tax=Mariniflexile sp. HNIBRBA6329 TaxID=3373088 RepID=UPI003744E541